MARLYFATGSQALRSFAWFSLLSTIIALHRLDKISSNVQFCLNIWLQLLPP
ncbi:MAG: hypothetical protein RIM23_19160 [Coleofasciculus sp. G3-WIS-01]|uniref:hypothetical protein n=1 Tax=Coleofasciculus sp. G3-WIS-01 TaxID=3069528 RepID=UPI0032F8E162